MRPSLETPISPCKSDTSETSDYPLVKAGEASDARSGSESDHPFYISLPWSPQMYFTVRGAENFHIYLWIGKDLSWCQDLYWSSMFFGIAAFLWVGILFWHAYANKNFTEAYMLIALTLWLAGNFTWMAGEVFENDDDYVVPRVFIVMMTAMAWIFLYHLVLKPFKLMPADDPMLAKRYEDMGLVPRFSYFENWRAYEHAHTLCWIGKDLSWNQACMPTWLLCLFPTVFIGCDFIYSTWKTKKMTIDTMHYVAQLIWVFGNAAWAAGEIYTTHPEIDDTVAYPMFTFGYNQTHQARWFSAWFLLAAYIPIILLYLVWLPLTFMGKIKAAEIPENEEYGESENGCLACIQNLWFTPPSASPISALATASPAKPSSRHSRSASFPSPLALENNQSSLKESMNPILSSVGAEQMHMQRSSSEKEDPSSQVHLNGPRGPIST